MSRPKKYNLPAPTDEEILSYDNVPVEIAARYLGISTKSVYEFLQDEIAIYGQAVKRESHHTHQISPGLLVKYKRGDLAVFPVEALKREIVLELKDFLDERLKLLQRAISELSAI